MIEAAERAKPSPHRAGKEVNPDETCGRARARREAITCAYRGLLCGAYGERVGATKAVRI